METVGFRDVKENMCKDRIRKPCGVSVRISRSLNERI
jgi:hypothetical protein